MKQITKLQEPNSLLQHRAQQFSNFDNIPNTTKGVLKQNLLLEQGHICCYCMRRIPEQSSPYMKVEHYKCQDHFQGLQLDYRNLLGACAGNEGQPKKLQTCDTKKGNENLTINPLNTNPSCETLFKFNSEGEMSSISDDEAVDEQINTILNLNMQSLKDARKEVYYIIQERVRAENKRTKKDKAAFVRFLNKELQVWQSKTDDKFRPYSLVAIYYLKKKLISN